MPQEVILRFNVLYLLCYDIIMPGSIVIIRNWYCEIRDLITIFQLYTAPIATGLQCRLLWSQHGEGSTRPVRNSRVAFVALQEAAISATHSWYCCLTLFQIVLVSSPQNWRYKEMVTVEITRVDVWTAKQMFKEYFFSSATVSESRVRLDLWEE